MAEYLRPNESFEAFQQRCTNVSTFDCTEEEMLWWMIGPRRLSLGVLAPATAVLLLIFATGMAGNAAVCVVIVRHPSMHTATNYYLFSLAVSDLLLLLFGKSSVFITGQLHATLSAWDSIIAIPGELYIFTYTTPVFPRN